MGCSANTRKEVKRNARTYTHTLGPPRRYYKCYGYQTLRLRCREKPMIRAERLEELVWDESSVKRVLQNPDLIVAGIEALNGSEDGGMDEERARLERDLQRVQLEEDRAIRLYVTGKISEEQLDHQRRFITERLESLQAKLEDCRAAESADVQMMSSRTPRSTPSPSVGSHGPIRLASSLVASSSRRQSSAPAIGYPERPMPTQYPNAVKGSAIAPLQTVWPRTPGTRRR